MTVNAIAGEAELASEERGEQLQRAAQNLTAVFFGGITRPEASRSQTSTAVFIP